MTHRHPTPNACTPLSPLLCSQSQPTTTGTPPLAHEAGPAAPWRSCRLQGGGLLRYECHMAVTSRLDSLSDAWDLIVEHYQDSGEAWPEEVCRLDLAVLEDRSTHPTKGRPIPGSRSLAKRWGVTHWKARRIVRETFCRDDRRTPAAHSPHTDRTPAQETKPAIEENAHIDRTQTAHIPPHARRDPGSPAPDFPEPEQKVSNLVLLQPPEPEASPVTPEQAVWSHWQSLAYPDGTQPHARARKLTKGDGKIIRSALEDYTPEDLMLVLSWAHEGPVTWWRERDRCTIQALLKAADLSGRFDQASAWDAKGRPAHGVNGDAHYQRQIDEWYHKGWTSVPVQVQGLPGFREAWRKRKLQRTADDAHRATASMVQVMREAGV